ncbi:DUF6503 family protein [Maribacter sp. CXY002]|uniref:DUF6503 family protein n=1 Tax=Maribacter luteocoastalis TaxID=3407671 RepID=UPI003B66F129
MYRLLVLLCVVLIVSCNETKPKISAQEIIDKSIEVSGGHKYKGSKITFDFREIQYTSESDGNRHILSRIIKQDSLIIKDVISPNGFQRFVNDSLVQLADTTANKYANSVNSVHYFSRLPYGLNDRAVKKKYLGKTIIKNQEYYKIEITFQEVGGGDDFDDVYIYWFNTSTFKPDYLAYEFHVNDGGKRFREAYNERYVNGIRFVDYANFKPLEKGASIYDMDKLFQNKELELLSKIELRNVVVNQGNYN